MKSKYKDFAGYILAGGNSSRMGRDKALLKINGKTFIENAVETLNPLCNGRIKIVLNKNKSNLLLEQSATTTCIYDLYPNIGVLAGVHASLKDCRKEYAIIIACDMPRITTKTLQILADKALSEEADAIIPKQDDGKLQPLCAVYRTEKCLQPLERFIDSEKSRSARDFLETLNIITIEQSNFCGSKNILLNVNYLADYESI